jgi:hypothetical protein
MSNNIGSITIVMLVIVAVSTLVGLGSTLCLGNGNIVEVIAEQIIDHELGVDIHLTEHK